MVRPVAMKSTSSAPDVTTAGPSFPVRLWQYITGKPVGSGLTAKAGMEQPVYYWFPDVAPSGLMFLPPAPSFRNGRVNLFVGSPQGACADPARSERRARRRRGAPARQIGMKSSGDVAPRAGRGDLSLTGDGSLLRLVPQKVAAAMRTHMDGTDSWPGSDVEREALADSIGVFLRTHKNGWSMLMDWLQSVPPDRTGTRKYVRSPPGALASTANDLDHTLPDLQIPLKVVRDSLARRTSVSGLRYADLTTIVFAVAPVGGFLERTGTTCWHGAVKQRKSRSVAHQKVFAPCSIFAARQHLIPFSV